MIYSVEDDVPAAWDNIITSFITCTEYVIEHNRVPEVYNIKISVKRGLLDINFCGGDKLVDGFAIFAREMSSTICSSCGAPSTRIVFGFPKCDECQ